MILLKAPHAFVSEKHIDNAHNQGAFSLHCTGSHPGSVKSRGCWQPWEFTNATVQDEWQNENESHPAGRMHPPSLAQCNIFTFDCSRALNKPIRVWPSIHPSASAPFIMEARQYILTAESCFE